MKDKFYLLLLVFVLVSMFSVKAQSLELDVSIVDFDVDESGTMMYFVAEGFNEDENIYLGAVEISGDGSLGSYHTRVIGSIVDGNVLSMDYQEGVIWIGFFEKVQMWSGLGSNRFGIDFASNYTYDAPSNSYAYFRDVKARPFYDTVMYACRVDSSYGVYGFEGVTVFHINVSNNELEPLFYVDSGENNAGVCRGIEINDDAELFVDNGVFGIRMFDIEANHNLTEMSDNDNRVYFWNQNSYFGRSDLMTLSGDYLFVTDGGTTTTSEAIQRLDVSNISSPVYTNTNCRLSESLSESRVNSIEAYNGSIVFFVDNYGADIHACQFVEGNTTYSVRVWDNPDGFLFNVGSNMEFWSDGGINYFYADTNQNVLSLFELQTTYDVGGNNLPYYTTAPDSEMIDNLNPIAVGVETNGLDSAEVVVRVLTCRNPNLYDCSKDVEGDDILFAVDKDYTGTFDIPAPSWWAYEGYSTTYSSAGNYTMRVYITDDVHPNVYLVYRDFNIEVRGNSSPLPENYSTLKFKVFDSTSNEELEGVYVLVEGVGSSYTDVVGETVEVVPIGVYLASFSKNGYVSQTHSYSTSSVQQFVYLDTLADASKRTLIVTVKDEKGSVLSDVYVQTQTKIYNTYDYKFTDATGKVVFFPTEDNVVVNIDADGYEVANFEVFVPLGSSVSRVVTLSEEGAIVEGIDNAFEITGCEDYIKGVLLCDYDKVECVNDSDCLTDYCVYNAVTDDGHCSNFNWNLCDADEMSRGNRCIGKQVFVGVMKGVGNWITDNFFFVLIIVFILVGGLVLALRHK